MHTLYLSTTHIVEARILAMTAMISYLSIPDPVIQLVPALGPIRRLTTATTNMSFERNNGASSWGAYVCDWSGCDWDVSFMWDWLPYMDEHLSLMRWFDIGHLHFTSPQLTIHSSNGRHPSPPGYYVSQHSNFLSTKLARLSQSFLTCTSMWRHPWHNVMIIENNINAINFFWAVTNMSSAMSCLQGSQGGFLVVFGVLGGYLFTERWLISGGMLGSSALKSWCSPANKLWLDLKWVGINIVNIYIYIVWGAMPY